MRKDELQTKIERIEEYKTTAPQMYWDLRYKLMEYQNELKDLENIIK